MPQYAPCIFCGKDGPKRTKEDVLPKWIGREFPGVWRTKIDHSARTFAKRNEFGIVSRAPCKECNNGWMSKLEAAAKPILLPLMKGVESELSAEQQQLIARWFLKTCIMFDVLHDVNPDYFEAGDRKALKESLTMPPKTFIFSARFDGSDEIRLHEMPIELVFGPTNDLARSYSYSATLAIKQLALQIFSFRAPENLGPSSFSIRIPRKWSEASIQIWPVVGTVRWPPRFALDDEGFNLFARRSGNLDGP